MRDQSTSIELLGVRIAGLGPVREAFVSLRPGLTVLYGLNGAGKSHVLRAVRNAFKGVDSSSELHFRSAPHLWRYPAVIAKPPIAFFRDSTVVNGDGDLEYEDYRNLLDEALADVGDITKGKYRPFEDVELATLKLAASLIADTPTLMLAMLQAVAQFRYVRRGNSLAIAADPRLAEPASPLGVLWGQAFESTAHMSRAQLWEAVITGGGPDNWDHKWDGYGSAFIGLGRLTSVCRQRLGYEGPAWCSDLLWEAPDWGPWPMPVIDPDHPGDLVELTLESLGRLEWYDRRTPFALGSADDISNQSLDLQELMHLEEAWHQGTPELGRRPLLPQRLLLVGDDGSERINPTFVKIAHELSEIASRIVSSLLPGAPLLVCQLPRPSEWVQRGAVEWNAIDPSGRLVPLGRLSDAQQRWSRFAIRLALGEAVGEQTPVILIDEPERALHRLAERHLAAGLSTIVSDAGAIAVVATHSPFLLDGRISHVHHIMRDRDGHTVVHELEPRRLRRIRELGLTGLDSLQLCRTALLVEGRHEEVILETYFGDELAAAGVEVFSMRGVTNLRTAADAQLLFRFTDARLVVLVDNEDHRQVSDIWARAVQLAAEGERFDAVLKEFTRGKAKSTEARFLKHFCEEALYNGNCNRVDVTALSLPDVVEYLPLRALVTGAPAGATWESLRIQHGRSAAGTYFKSWLERNYAADFSDDALRQAASTLHEIHPELTALLDRLRA